MNWTEIVTDALSSALGVNGAIYALAAIGLNIHFGYTGLLNFGHVGFMLVGAYGLAITVAQGGSFWLGLVIGMAAAALLGLALGLPTLRLRADYLAIVTIAAAEILRLLFRSGFGEDVLKTRGVFGIQGFADTFYQYNWYSGTYEFFGVVFRSRSMWIMTWGWILAFLLTGVVWLLMRSPWGRVLKSIREDEDAARSLGKNVFGFKIQSLVLGGVIGGLGGILFAIAQQNVNPDAFLPILTFFVYAVVILGGPGSVWGPIVGSIIFWFLIDFTRGFMEGLARTSDLVGGALSSQGIASMRFVLIGLGLVLLMVYRPQGLFGSKEEMLLDAR